MTDQEFGLLWMKELDGLFDPSELRSMCAVALDVLSEQTKLERLIRPFEFQEQTCLNLIAKLKAGNPLQYALGYAFFAGLRLQVNEAVLIPRQETEELVMESVRLLKNEGKINAAVLDIGTGSGCIALSIKQEYPSAKLFACDVSSEALKIALANAQRLQLELQLAEHNILEELPFKGQQFDMIVSNPPYVLESDRSLMSKQVLDFEPDLALFVPNEDPLLFYRRIAQLAKVKLNTNGYLLFEIHESQGAEMLQLLAMEGFAEIALLQDINGKDRITSARYIR